MSALHLKYRPRELANLVGQDKAIGLLSRHLKSLSNQSLLLVGPSGTGKTSGARIVGASLLCEVSPPQACGQCRTCMDLLAGTAVLNWCEMDGARFTLPKHVEQLAKLLKDSHSANWRWVYFIDEVHRLTGAAADMLLKAVEEPGENSQFIAATTDLAAVPLALRKRCEIVPFSKLTHAQSYKVLSDVCQAEGFRYEPRALDMIATSGEGSARDSLIKLGQIAGLGEITSTAVAEMLALGSAEHVVAYFDAMLAADGNAQETALSEWPGEPMAKARLIREYLLYAYNFDVARPRLNEIVNAAFFQISAEERGRLVSGLRARASEAGRPLADYWIDLMEVSDAGIQNVADHASLSIRARKFHRLINPEDRAPVPPSLPPAAIRTGERPYRARSSNRRTLTWGNDHLNLRQAEAIYDRASFLAQNHGCLFDTHLLLDHAKLGAGDEASAGWLISNLTHEMAMRVSGWAGGKKAHWQYVHEASSAGMVTHIIAHIPVGGHGSLKDWVENRLNEWRAPSANGPDAWSIDLPNPKMIEGYRQLRIKRHWQLVRRLWGGVSPDIDHWSNDGRRRPLLELLDVPKDQRRRACKLQTLRRLGSSNSLGPAMRKAAEAMSMSFLSAFADAAWAHLDTGWELDEFEARAVEIASRVDATDRVNLEWPAPSLQIEIDGRRSAIAKLEASWPVDAKDRRRSWRGWW